MMVLTVPLVRKVRQPGTVGGRKVAPGSDSDDQHVVVRRRDFEVNVQPPRSAGDEKVFAIVVAAEIPPPTGAQITFDQLRAHLLIRHETYVAADDFADALSQAMWHRRIC